MVIFGEYLKLLMEYLVSVYTTLPAIIVVGIGAYSAFYETHNLNEANLERERIFAQVVGWLYMVGGSLLFIGVKIYSFLK
ncbi:MAG: hypothetical protein AWU54_746 [Candidatus Frackibacter sp. T328-2]|nr:MAG: hypothetical protein AWU54_746 [Candidatus Frackibacter sp. T328-2]